MKKAWKVILIIVLAAILAGAILIGVGYFTGADTARIYQAVDDKYQVGNLVTYLQNIFDMYVEAWNSVP